VEFATLEYIDWFNNRRLHGEIGYVPPAEYEEMSYASRPTEEIKGLYETRGDSGWKVSRKRVRRIWRQEGLQVPARKKRRRKGRRAPGDVAPSRPNQVWVMDFQFDDITRGRRIKILNITDEFTRESLAGHVARHITAKDTVGVLEQIVVRRGAPRHVRCDNGHPYLPESVRVLRPKS